MRAEVSEKTARGAKEDCEATKVDWAGRVLAAEGASVGAEYSLENPLTC